MSSHLGEQAELHRFHLFNCDHTFNLETVEDLLMAAEVKLGSTIPVEQHYFPLFQMSELCRSTIHRLQMDSAILVVNAKVSRLSFNEDVGHGYAMIYRALLKATGEKVIVVIGGDDNYENEDEEERVVLSHWSRRRISSQFTEEFMDGRKSFIFSWDKKHRPIHEEALLHYFGKTGLKFDYQPKPKIPEEPANQSPIKTKPANQSLVKTKPANQSLDHKMRRGYSADDAGASDVSSFPGVSRQRGEQQPRGGQKTSFSAELRSYSGTRREESGHLNTGIPDSGQGAGPKVHHPPIGKKHDLVILDCNTADESIRSVKQVIEELRPNLNLSSDPPVERGTAVELNSYLMMNSVRFCVLVVDAETIKDAYDNLPKRKKEYQKLLETASEKVEEKVIVTVCGPHYLPPGDEDRVNLAITRILDEKNKGFMVWLKGGRIQVGHEVLLEIMSSIAITGSSNPKASNPAGVGGASKVSSVPCSQDPFRVPPRGGLVRSYSADDSSNVSSCPGVSGQHGNLPQGGHVTSFSPGYGGASNVPFVPSSRDEQPGQSMGTSQSTNLPDVSNNIPIFRTRQEENVRVLVKAHLRYGRIFLEEGDFWLPGWKVPEYIRTNLMKDYSEQIRAELLLFLDDGGVLQCRVNPKFSFGINPNKGEYV